MLGLQKMAEYTERPDQTSVWLERYPRFSKETGIYLGIINEVFRLTRDEQNKVRPTDDIDKFGQTLRSKPFGWSDELEYELLKRLLREKLNCNLGDTFQISGHTFGSLFDEVMKLLLGLDNIW